MTSRQAVLLALVVSSFAIAAPTTVALDVSTVDAAAFEALDGVALEKTATVRLVQEGFAVIAPTASPDVLVTVSVNAEPRSIVLSGKGPGGSGTRSIPWATETQAELHLEVTQKLVELTRVVARAPVVTVVEPVVERTAPRWQLGAGGGVLLREGGVDGLGVATLRWGERLRFAADFGLGGSRGAGIGIIETTLAVGIAYALQFDRWHLEAAVVLGALLHVWSLDTSTSGVRVSPLVNVPLQVSFAVTPLVSIGLRLAPGWSGAREHVSGDTVLWTRGPLRLETAGVVALRW
ncbi:MAG: hypothetical protein GQE15_08550 [Archangiaceae bacterium]|nr:hypothetical protein [Archangiaceae bacterium]